MLKEYFYNAMLTLKDQLNRRIQLKSPPKRIISLVPSQSEFLWDIGLREEMVGITKFCIHPAEMHKSIERVGGTKTLNLEKIRKLKPDLIIANKEENDQAQIEVLQKEFNVWISDIYTFDDAFNMMRSLGEIVGKQKKAEKLIQTIQTRIGNIKNYFAKQKVAYFIWNKPYMFVAQNTFIHYVLDYVGFKNALSSLLRYPQLSDDELITLNPDFCFLSSEPFPFKQKHIKELQTKLPNAKILIVDGEVFSWYGSRLLSLENYIVTLKKRMDA